MCVSCVRKSCISVAMNDINIHTNIDKAALASMDLYHLCRTVTPRTSDYLHLFRAFSLSLPLIISFSLPLPLIVSSPPSLFPSSSPFLSSHLPVPQVRPRCNSNGDLFQEPEPPLRERWRHCRVQSRPCIIVMICEVNRLKDDFYGAAAVCAENDRTDSLSPILCAVSTL